MTDGSTLDLRWLPVGAGTRFQRASLDLYERVAAGLARRPRALLLHSALEVRLDGVPHTLEVMPMRAHQERAPLMTGPVGVRVAGCLRVFRYQLYLSDDAHPPDARWAIGEPHRLTSDPMLVHRLLDLAPSAPSHTWGRRVAGTTEMWTSDSTIAWLLCRAGIDAGAIGLPPGCRAPGWAAGWQLARSAGGAGSMR